MSIDQTTSNGRAGTKTTVRSCVATYCCRTQVTGKVWFQCEVDSCGCAPALPALLLKRRSLVAPALMLLPLFCFPRRLPRLALLFCTAPRVGAELIAIKRVGCRQHMMSERTLKCTLRSDLGSWYTGTLRQVHGACCDGPHTGPSCRAQLAAPLCA